MHCVIASRGSKLEIELYVGRTNLIGTKRTRVTSNGILISDEKGQKIISHRTLFSILSLFINIYKSLSDFLQSILKEVPNLKPKIEVIDIMDKDDSKGSTTSTTTIIVLNVRTFDAAYFPKSQHSQKEKTQ